VLVPANTFGDREEIIARSLGATSVSTDVRVIAELAGGRKNANSCPTHGEGEAAAND
jgi:hypothetical protein